MTVTWSEEAIRALGTRTDLPTAGAILAGLSRTQSYELYKAGRFPVPVFAVGRRLIVPLKPVLILLGLEVADEQATRDERSDDAKPARRQLRALGG